MELNSIEKEVILLNSIIDSINECINYSLFKLNGNEQKVVMLHTKVCQSFFYIQLVDFLSPMENSITGKRKNSLDTLFEISNNLQLNRKYKKNNFQSPLNEFKNWYEKKTVIQSWFPTLNKTINLSIKRSDIISICGNMTKHSIFHLSKMTKIFKEILEENKVNLENTQPELLLKEFYCIFNDDVLLFYTSHIVKMLNNIRWIIHYYLLPIYDNCIKVDKKEKGKYSYIYPKNIEKDYSKNIFYDLMNKTRTGPFIPKFEILKFLKNEPYNGLSNRDKK